MEQATLGNHIIVEFYDCKITSLSDVSKVEKAMIEAAKEAGATVVGSNFHQFNPYGVSGVVIIAESHLTIHTWPEYGYAAVDLFTCGDTVDNWKAFDYLKNFLGSSSVSSVEMKRGNLRDIRGNVRNNIKGNASNE